VIRNLRNRTLRWNGHVEEIKAERILKNEFRWSPQEGEGNQGVYVSVKHIFYKSRPRRWG
jgi:hypothetical protein